MKLLHIDSSALGGYSVSRQLSSEIVAELTRNNPDIEVTYRDLAAQSLPHWTPVPDAAHPDAVLGNEVLEEFLAADVVVIGAPMYNFGISSQLKSWIDRILIAGKTFRYSASGAEGLAGGKQVIIASSRGGSYGSAPYAAMDFQEPYLRTVLGFIGIDALQFVRAEGLAHGDEHKAQAIAAAKASIGGLSIELAQAA
ncbi:NAD(P)H-dependent oxidoreductase [Rhodanobacter sp. L36]|uniref:FMN-dependent NADH-azoreductase n=1 Tax=Rhodanobacter sp. L36 TaxID=1747221 RepID=UPI00131CE2F2|nr:NAD(P)H-dependent oxidoreductase [Rhodanobacter sp. L36]